MEPHKIPLSDQEYEVLRHVRDDLTSKEIGIKLNITARKVEQLRANLKLKFHATKTAGMIARATALGYV